MDDDDDDDDEVVVLLELVVVLELVVLLEDEVEDVDDVEEELDEESELEPVTSTAVPPFAVIAYTENALAPPHISAGYPKHVLVHPVEVDCESAGLSFPQ